MCIQVVQLAYLNHVLDAYFNRIYISKYILICIKFKVIKHNRYFGANIGMLDSAQITPNDRVFVTLPIYHGNGHFLGN